MTQAVYIHYKAYFYNKRFDDTEMYSLMHKIFFFYGRTVYIII